MSPAALVQYLNDMLKTLIVIDCPEIRTGSECKTDQGVTCRRLFRLVVAKAVWAKAS